MNYWHFTGDKLRDGRLIPLVDEWLVHIGQIEMCKSGLHASAHPFDALAYAPGPLLHLVQLNNIVKTQNDKVVARERKIIKTIDATGLLRSFACRCALDVKDLWKMPDIVRQYLETQDEKIRAAAGAAARTAAWAAAWAAARAAARTAAWAAAWAAARAAAEAAAGAAARTAAWAAKLNLYKTWFLESVNKEFGI